MDDFTYDIVQKKRIARGARHKKNGSKSKWCHLPSDNLTAKQLKERNGPIMSYALNVPMDWETFKSMPLDLQQTYLDNLGSRFKVGFTVASRELFGRSDAALYAYAKRVGLKPSTKGIRLSESEREIWENWLNHPVGVTLDPREEVQEIPEAAEPEIAEPVVEEPTVANEAPARSTFSPGGIGSYAALLDYATRYAPHCEPEPAAAKPLGLSHLSATFTGEFDAEKFLNWITKLPMPEGDVRISVEVSSR